MSCYDNRIESNQIELIEVAFPLRGLCTTIITDILRCQLLRRFCLQEGYCATQPPVDPFTGKDPLLCLQERCIFFQRLSPCDASTLDGRRRTDLTKGALEGVDELMRRILLCICCAISTQ